MALRTAVFIDGANFRGNLRDFGFTSELSNGRVYRLEERHFNWDEFFSGVLDKFNAETGWEHQLIRVHWYSAATISPWPRKYEFPLSQKVVTEHSGIKGLTTDVVLEKARDWYSRERSYFERLREDTFERIQREINFLEFRYVGQYKVLPLQASSIQERSGEIEYRGTRVGEKGVDLGIAVDMIAKMPYYDVAILVSGDADFLPVVGYLKDHLKYVYQFSIAKGVPPSIRYLSPYLKGKVDCFESYNELELLDKFLLREKGIPPDILVAIDNRITQLSDGTYQPTMLVPDR